MVIAQGPETPFQAPSGAAWPGRARWFRDCLILLVDRPGLWFDPFRDPFRAVPTPPGSRTRQPVCVVIFTFIFSFIFVSGFPCERGPVCRMFFWAYGNGRGKWYNRSDKYYHRRDNCYKPGDKRYNLEDMPVTLQGQVLQKQFTIFLEGGLFRDCFPLSHCYRGSGKWESQELWENYQTPAGRKKGSCCPPFSSPACLSVRTPGRSAECRVENAVVGRLRSPVAKAVCAPHPPFEFRDSASGRNGRGRAWRWCLQIGTGRWRCLQDTAARVRMDYIGHSPRQVLFIDRGHGRRTVPDLDLVRRPPSYGRTALMNGILGTDPTLSELVDSKPPDPG